MKKNVIYDGDMGGDDLWAFALLASLVKQQKIDLLGITTSFGNTTLDQATRNICDMADYLGYAHIPVFKGASKPMGDIPPLLDGAFGETGLSLATLPQSTKGHERENAVDWIAKTLKEKANETVTIIGTGPATNIAPVFANYPELDRNNVEILWFGGAIAPCGANHMPFIEDDGEPRIGNITKYAEFNAINDVVAAQALADLKQARVAIMPLDASQHMDVSLSKILTFQSEMTKIGAGEMAHLLSMMLHDVACLDESKLGAKGTYIHDAQLIQYFANPELFLLAVPVENIQFANHPELARDFDAVTSGFDFSRLGRHGQMSANATQISTNKFIVPGLYSFGCEVDVSTQDVMANRRWDSLMKKLIDIF